MRILNATALNVIAVLLGSCLSTPQKLYQVQKGIHTPYYERDCAHLYPLYFDRLHSLDPTKVERGWASFLIDGFGPAVENWSSSPESVAAPYGLRPGTHTLAIQGLRRIEDPPDGSYYSGPAKEFQTDIVYRDYDFKPGEAYALLSFRPQRDQFVCLVVPLGKRGRLVKFVTEPGESLVIDGTRLDGGLLARAAALLNAASDKEDTWTDR